MANTRDLRRRIKSVKNTSQITKAMQMVSATKMRRAQNQTLSARPYALTISQALSTVSSHMDPELHELIRPTDSDKVGVLMLSPDKGLCGALNTNLVRRIMNEELRIKSEGKEVVYYTVGKKGRDFVVRTGKSLEADFESMEHIEFHQARKIRNFIVSAFLHNEVGSVYLAYPHFLSTLRQEPRLLKLLPVDKEVLSEILGNGSPVPIEQQIPESAFVFEPSADVVLDWALTHLIDTQIYQAILETRASEHSARMIAMQNATENAQDLVSDLTLTYNQVRQDGITRELLEIASAGAALE